MYLLYMYIYMQPNETGKLTNYHKTLPHLPQRRSPNSITTAGRQRRAIAMDRMGMASPAVQLSPPNRKEEHFTPLKQQGFDGYSGWFFLSGHVI